MGWDPEFTTSQMHFLTSNDRGEPRHMLALNVHLSIVQPDMMITTMPDGVAMLPDGSQ